MTCQYWLATCDQCSHQDPLGAGIWDSALYLHWVFRKATKITILFLKEKAEYSLSILFPKPEIHLRVPFPYCCEQVPPKPSSVCSPHPSPSAAWLSSTLSDPGLVQSWMTFVLWMFEMFTLFSLSHLCCIHGCFPSYPYLTVKATLMS